MSFLYRLQRYNVFSGKKSAGRVFLRQTFIFHFRRTFFLFPKGKCQSKFAKTCSREKEVTVFFVTFFICTKILTTPERGYKKKWDASARSHPTC